MMATARGSKILGSAGERPRVLVLLGAGRGGTTLLYKLLALHRQVGYLSSYQQRFPGLPMLALLQRAVRDRHALKLAAWFKPDGGAYFQGRRDRFRALVPTPFECERFYSACGIPRLASARSLPDRDACRRLHRAFASVARWSASSVVVTKRTANNRRVPWLEAGSADPLYVHLLRDGRAVARSLRQVHWWRDHTLFWAGQTPAQLIQTGHDELELAARNWVEELAQIRQGLEQVPQHRVLTVRYESLLAEPAVVLRDILAFAGVEASADARFAAAVSSLRLRPGAGLWDDGLNDSERQCVMAVQHDELQRWGYLDPEWAGFRP